MPQYTPSRLFQAGKPADGGGINLELQRIANSINNIDADQITSSVSSVFGRSGAVVAATNDYTWAQIDKSTSDIADITTKSHTSLSDIGTNTHAQIDTHIADLSNPHSVTATQVGAIADAINTVDDTHIDWGTGANQVSAVDVPIADSGLIITATEVEGALQENRTAIDLNTTHRGLTTGNPHSVTPTDLSLVIGTDVLAQQTIGIADNNLVEIDSISVADNDYAKFTINGLEGRSYTEVKTDLSLDKVSNIQDKVDAITAPVATNDTTEGYSVGSRWIDVTNDKIYFCLDATTGAAVWSQGEAAYDWKGAWATATAYVINDCVENDGSGYVCILAHTSGASTEPGTGASWTTYWDIFSQGANFTAGEGISIASGVIDSDLAVNGGWLGAGETWTYASATTFTITGDKTDKYSIGMKIKLTQTTDKFFWITAVSYSAPNTTITIDGRGTYTLANTTITSPNYSVAQVPFGWVASMRDATSTNKGIASFDSDDFTVTSGDVVNATKTAVKAYRSTAQTMTNIVYTTIIYNTEVYDNLGEYNTSTGIFTANKTGKYHIEASHLSANVAWVTGEYNLLQIYHNSSGIAQDRRQHQASSTQYADNFVSTDTILTAGDTIQIRMLQNSGANIGITTGIVYTRLCIHRID